MGKEIKKMIAILTAIIFFVGLDRFLKILALVNSQKEFEIIGQWLKFGFAFNYNIAFSLPFTGWALILATALIIMALMVFAVYLAKQRKFKQIWPLFMIIGGASCNLWDRLKYGYVIDYLDLKYFTVFNLADSMIVVGVTWLILVAYKNELE